MGGESRGPEARTKTHRMQAGAGTSPTMVDGGNKMPAISIARALQLLRNGTFRETHGPIPWSSNHTFLMSITDGELETPVIYKPRRGERPLWDFPDGTLCLREVAAFVVSEALGWHIVPPTVLRDGPLGVGMIQLFIVHDPEQNYFTLGPRHRSQLQRIALFDHIINNADRKGGHCLIDEEGYIWAIDHGICFHASPKLRTVIWDFADQKIPEPLVVNIRELLRQLEDSPLVDTLDSLLDRSEIHSLCRRVEYLIRTGQYPEAGPGRNYPWPPV